jgi:tetratricopeptide (TPR) repeat protein
MSTTVFISYSHDSDEHRQKVLALAERLRADGIATLLDQYLNGTPAEGWPRWMLDQLDAAAFVLVVCTQTYYLRFRGHEEPGKGKGVDWEGALITSELYAARSRSLKFVPVFLSSAVEDWIPEPLRAGTHYTLTSEDAYQRLYDFLLQQSGVEPGPVGTLKTKPRPKGTPLTFDESSPRARPVDISRIIKYAPSDLIGRDDEIKVLGQAWAKVRGAECPRPHIFTLVALGGEGKTSVVAKWVADLASQDWPGCDAAFAWSFYSQGTREQLAASSDLFLNEALKFFGDAAMAASAQGGFDKGRRLAQLVGERRALLILDGLEPLQYAPTSPTPGELKDQGISALLKGLAATNNGLCVATTRYSIPDLRAFWQTTAPEQELKRLSRAAGVSLLRKLGVVTGSQEEFEHLVEEVNGHALTLQIMAGFLKKAFHGDIRCRDRVRFEKADAKVQGGHAFRAMAAYVKWMEDESDEARRDLAILRLMGLFDRPATGDCVAALLKAPAIAGLTEPLIGLAEEDWNFSLDALQSAKLLTVHRAPGSGVLVALDAHPLLREYFGQRLRVTQPEAWQAAHRRLYQHLCATTKEGNEPTLEDLQPLYQAVAHGCQAGLQQEAFEKVFYPRIDRREAYGWKKLGAFGTTAGAVACFFEISWSRISHALNEGSQAWLLNEAGTCLRALGRLTEALEPMRAGLEIRVRQKVWKSAAIIAHNLSEVELTIGEVARAVGDAEQSVIYADRSGDGFERMTTRAVHADALHQAGRRAEAEAGFREAEQIQAERHPAHLLLSLWGFQYCDLLLTEAEREAGKAEGELEQEELPAKCRAVSDRAAQTLNWEEGMRGVHLLDFALHHLTLGRAGLYVAIFKSRGRRGESAPPPTPEESQRGLTSAAAELDHAVSGLRRAGTQDHLPRGLLTRAWLRSLTGPGTGPESASSDLDEAWEIAERGPMPLFLADIHLYRARLFFREQPYPWTSAQHDLAEARHLIFKHGYLRRKEELEDAEAALRHFGSAPTQ